MTACGNQITTPAAKSETWELLANALYPLELTDTRSVQLVEGQFEVEAAPGSASKISISLSEEIAEGDLNGDGNQDAAVILVADTGGSGTFFFLSAVIFENNAPNPIASIYLGDRLEIRSISIDSGLITVEMLTREINESMSAEPNLEAKQIFRLQDGNLFAIQ